ncbi:MAG: hypothetical protein GY715_00185 [Planctomycetes bacterium]|nr:hypothetical protein [Planctomycetota bacterium]
MPEPEPKHAREVLKPAWVGPAGCGMIIASAVLFCGIMVAVIAVATAGIFAMIDVDGDGHLGRPIGIIALAVAFLLSFAAYGKGLRRSVVITVCAVLIAISLLFAQIDGDLIDAIISMMGLTMLHVAIWLLVFIVRGYDRLWSDAHWRARALAQHRCPWCGYSTRGLTDHRCPECGEGLP